MKIQPDITKSGIVCEVFEGTEHTSGRCDSMKEESLDRFGESGKVSLTTMLFETRAQSQLIP